MSRKLNLHISISMVVSMIVMAISACQPTAKVQIKTDINEPPPTETIAATTTPRELATPYALQPAAGICGGAIDEEIASVEIWPDIPSPRCLQVSADQKLRVVNRTNEVLSIKLGRLTGQIKPGEFLTLDEPFGNILEPGVHLLTVSPFGGPELWLGK